MSALRKAPDLRPDPGVCRIPVSCPRLASADELLPYLRRMDEAGWYSNFGPLLREFEARLAARFDRKTAVATAVNATQALTLGLQALEVGVDKLCILPAFTFAATAHAVVAAGLIPWFADVDASTWMLDPESVLRALPAAPGEVGAVVPVSAFGRPPDVEAWAAFRDESGLPVLIDAAAAFDSVRKASAPVVVSLHATKVLGVGEGGFIASEDEAFVARFRALTTFGFDGDRIATRAATNAKLSEYGCAVGLAALDAWPAVRLRYRAAAQTLRMSLLSAPHIGFQPGWGAEWVSSTCVVGLPSGRAEAVQQALSDAAIETRHWWGQGCHHAPAFAEAPRMPMPVTDQIVRSTLGLPFYREMDGEVLDRLAFVLSGAG